MKAAVSWEKIISIGRDNVHKVYKGEAKRRPFFIGIERD